MSLLPDTKIPTTWVKGITKQSSSSGFDYKNHCYGQCGDSVGVPPCMVSYFVNDDKGPVPYSILFIMSGHRRNITAGTMGQ